jgi:glucose-1-phosphate cytidylyltransferase
MKAVILAGGLGTRIAEESSSRPKPMVEIGGKPILWHIMKIFSAHGIHDFVICCGYKGYVIKEYFANYFLHMSDVTFDMTNNNAMQIHHKFAEPWKVTLIDTGENTQTGGRLKRVKHYLGEEDFCFVPENYIPFFFFFFFSKKENFHDFFCFQIASHKISC